jgi:hypothetical protein
MRSTGHRFVPFCCGLVELSARRQWKGTKLSEGPDTTGQTNQVEHTKSNLESQEDLCTTY